jgi:hypothetical protein
LDRKIGPMHLEVCSWEIPDLEIYSWEHHGSSWGIVQGLPGVWHDPPPDEEKLASTKLSECWHAVSAKGTKGGIWRHGRSGGRHIQIQDLSIWTRHMKWVCFTIVDASPNIWYFFSEYFSIATIVFQTRTLGVSCPTFRMISHLEPRRHKPSSTYRKRLGFKPSPNVRWSKWWVSCEGHRPNDQTFEVGELWPTVHGRNPAPVGRWAKSLRIPFFTVFIGTNSYPAWWFRFRNHGISRETQVLTSSPKVLQVSSWRIPCDLGLRSTRTTIWRK